MPRPGELAVLPAVHRDAAPTYRMEPIDIDATAPMEPVDPDATGTMDPLDAPVTAPTDAASTPASTATAPSELPTPVPMPAIDPPVRATVARRRLRSSPPSPAPAPASGSSRAIVFAAGGAAVLLVVIAGYLIGRAANSGSSSSNSTASVSQSVGSNGASASTGSARARTTTAGAAGTTSVPSAGRTATFTGREFSIKYPAGWIIQSNQKLYSWGTDTTVVSPANAQTLLRVDISPHLKTSDPLSASQAEISQVSKQPGYQQLGLTSTTVNGNPGERWEFLVNDNGMLEHSVDEFIIAPNGDGVAILTQAPASRYASLAEEFTALRRTIAVRSS